VYFQAKPGSTVALLAEREGWAQVARRDGRRRWIERQTLAPL
jgi:SH3-like domain-containing protein